MDGENNKPTTHSPLSKSLASDDIANIPLGAGLAIVRDTFADRGNDELLLVALPEGDRKIDAKDLVRVDDVEGGCRGGGNGRNQGGHQGDQRERASDEEHFDDVRVERWSKV